MLAAHHSQEHCLSLPIRSTLGTMCAVLSIQCYYLVRFSDYQPCVLNAMEHASFELIFVQYRRTCSTLLQLYVMDK